MTKELFVSSTPHETKVALVEDDQLAEVYFERENEYTLAGSIYKGRVTRVLPGMQSAFVDIGLERDAFLYVSDFLELQDEEGEVQEITVGRQPQEASSSEAPKVNGGNEPEAGVDQPGEASAQAPTEGNSDEKNAAAEKTRSPEDENGERGGWRNRRRRRGRRGRGMPESKFSHWNEPRPAPAAETTTREPVYQPIILPGESISKYQRLGQTAQERPAVEVSGEPSRAEVSELTAASPSGDRDTSDEMQPASSGERESHGRTFIAVDEQAGIDDSEEPRVHELRDQESRGELTAAQRKASYEQVEEQGAEHADRVYQSSAGTVEEEEIEDEESEEASLAEELDDVHFEELEEETHEASERRDGNATEPEAGNGVELGEAVKETDTERAVFANEFEPAENGDASPAEGTEEEEEVDEAELLADAAHEQAEAGATELEAQAEVRGPAATAGYQQRTARPEWERRGGRRFPRKFRRREQQRPHPAIADLLKEGQEILVQIAKEPIGKKGARITSHIALPGRFLVYMPTVSHTGVSRKIASEEERQRLKRIVLSERENGVGGFIVRTAAANTSEDELRADIRFLKSLWHEIKHRAENSKPPALIYHDLNLVERILRDQVTQDFGQIWVDNEQEYERVLRFVSRFQPALTKRVKLYTKPTPLFEQFNLQEEINKALKSKVWLKSGGYIVINQTEALVAIDINTGKYVGKTARLEDTIVKTNVDAIKEIVRQIRLRDLGGIIVIDFIDMDERRNRQKVMQALEEALRADRAPSKVLQFNDFGLVAITRKRVKQSLERTLGSSCPYCTGTGFVKSVGTICNEIYTEMRKIAKELEGQDVMLRVNPEVGKALKANNGRLLQEMEELTRRTIIVKTDPALHQEQFDIN
ncbi:MAG TPA: Rne/Rng family ribonuclease [Terriglobales bacterium]|nr:Rne/Rng family ribonuclease [Terriglobales bacterium]